MADTLIRLFGPKGRDGVSKDFEVDVAVLDSATVTRPTGLRSVMAPSLSAWPR